MKLKYLQLFLVLCLACASPVAFCQENFEDWLIALQHDAVVNGISAETAEAAVEHIQLLPNIIKLDHAQPEFISPFLDYYNQRVDLRKVMAGREKMNQHQPLLHQLEMQYGVPKAYLIAFWGMETNYGQDKGHIDTLSSLATLAFDGRRAHFFREQLLDAMRMMDQKNVMLNGLVGSWAGAFGHMQFMPSTFMIYAIDGDGDQHIDLTYSEADALSSAANYLSQVGWREDAPTMIEVQLPTNFALQEARLNNKKTIAEWMDLGVLAIQGQDHIQSGRIIPTKTKLKKTKLKQHKHHLTSQVDSIKEKLIFKTSALNMMIEDASQRAAILLPQGWRGPAFMVFDNFDAIMDWNRSVNYALSVAQLAQRLNSQMPVLGGQQAETGALTFTQMQQLQIMLNALGFDAGEPDGFPGLKTQAAVRAYQVTQHLPADGYASPSLFHRLNQAATITLQ